VFSLYPAKRLCPNGPRQGERQVGATPGGNGVASMPVCVATGQATGGGLSAAPAQRWVNSHLAVATHDSANDVWTAAGYRVAGTASYEALKACNNAMGGGCKIFIEGYNGAVLTARNSYGELWARTEETVDKARRRVYKDCESKGISCEELVWVTANAWLEDIGAPTRDQPKIYSPPDNSFRKSHSAAAWVTDKNKWTQKVWITGRHPTKEAAKEAALSACNKDSGTVCELAQAVSDTSIYVGVDDTRGVRIGAALNAKQAAKQIELDCGKTASKCTLTGSFSARTEGTQIHDPYFVEPAGAKKQ
jgi:hypothetical protein